MTTTVVDLLPAAVVDLLPAALGGPPAFPEGLPLVQPYIPGVPALAARLERVLASGVLTNGPTVRAFEAACADYIGVRHIVAVSSCTAGLMLVLQACGLDGRTVALPSFTFSATAHAAHWAGGSPRFVDIEAEVLTVDPEQARLALPGAGALMATHLYGSVCEVERLEELAAAADVPLVFDAAHALGSRRRGRLVGGFGTAEVFSLSPTKVVVAGEGGVIATNDDAVAEACRLGRDYGNPGNYDCRFPGLNARMSELHATVALASLEGLDDRVAHRTGLVERFRDAVAGLPGLRVVTPFQGDTSTFKDLTVVVDPRAFGLNVPQLAAALRADGIDSRRYFYPPVHRQQAYADGDATVLPVTEQLAERVLSPPLWSHMTEAQIDDVSAAFVRIQRHAAAVREVLPG